MNNYSRLNLNLHDGTDTEQNENLISLFNYFNKNKIQYETLLNPKSSYIVLKIFTLIPKFFLIILDEKSNKTLSVSYNILNSFRNFIELNKIISKDSYIIFLDPSIQSISELKIKTKFTNFTKVDLNLEYKRIKKTNVNILIKKNLRRGLPLGKYNRYNSLNDLTGKEWIKFTKSWFILNPPPRMDLEISHPATFPNTLIEKFIKFFTKEREIVLDPFIGTGTTLYVARDARRSCIGIELNQKYVKIAKSHLKQQTLDHLIETDSKPLFYKLYHEDSLEIDRIWKKDNLPLVDFCITSPPYWNQLIRNNFRQRDRKKVGLATYYSEDPRDIGNIEDYRKFLDAQKNIFYKIYEIMKLGGYLVIITNNIYKNSKLYPLAFDTAIDLSKKWVLKDERIWCQDDKNLIPLGINSSYIGNRHHVYCLVFRKEET